jgi:hypothetical protein
MHWQARRWASSSVISSIGITMRRQINETNLLSEE